MATQRPLRRAAMVIVVAVALLGGTPSLPDPTLLSRQPLVVVLDLSTPARRRRRRHYRGYR